MRRERPETSRKPFPMPWRRRPMINPGMESSMPKRRAPAARTTRPIMRVTRREKARERGPTKGQVRNWTIEVMEKMRPRRVEEAPNFRFTYWKRRRKAGVRHSSW